MSVLLSKKKQGRRVLLGEELDETVHLYLRKTRQGGRAVSTRSMVAAARAIVLTMNHSLLTKFGQELGAFFVEEDEVCSEKIDNIKKQVYR